MKWNRWQDLHVKDIAIVIIFLLMMLPVTSSNAFAASINSADAYGSYGVKGYRAGTDTIFLNVSAVITEDSDVGPNQLKIIEDPTRPFDCTLIDPATLTYNCIVKYPESTLPAGYPTMTFSVQVVSDAGVAISPVRQGSLIVDSLPPVMVDIDYNVLDSGVVEATGTFEDKACDGPGCTEKCSGIKSIEFMVESASIGKKSDFDRKSCVHKTSINLSGFIAGGDVGKKHICIEMTYNFDQKDTKCSDVFIDALKPEIKGIRIMGANNQQIRYTNGQPIFPVSIVVDLYDHSGLIDPVSGEERIIRVDASSLSEREDHQEAYKNLQSSSCTSNAENQYNCTVSGLFLIASSQKNIDIRVMANDSQGNKLNETRTLRLVFDSTPPTATRIYSSFPDAAGEFWVGEEDNVIMMDITETGSGMADMNVFLDFSQLNTALGLVHPNECIAGWTCKWRYIDVKIPSGSVVSLTPKGESADDTGNFLQGGQGTLRVDVDPPEIDDALRAVSNITAIGEGHNPWLDITGGDILEIHLFVKDHSGIKSAMANFSDIIEDGLESVVGVCEEHQILPGVDETIFECIWATEPVLEGYRKDLEIIFTFEDYVNHTYEYTWDGIEILQKENVSTPTWLIEYEDSSPSQGMDRLSWRLAQPRMFFRHKFTSLRGSHVYPASIVLDPQTCTNLEYVTVDPLTNEISIKMMDYPGYYTRPEPPFEDITEIQFNPEAVPEAEYMDANNLTQPLEEFEIDCAVIITSIVDFGSTKSLTMPEIVNISFPVKVYNNKMGQNIGNINDEIAEMEKHIKAFRWLTIMRQIFQIAENICDMISTLIRIDGMIAAAKDIFQTACNANTAACSVNAGMAKILSDDTEALMEFVQGFYHFCELF
ncbi:hypothetical protein HQ545_00300, partial [Candidatus Woesearchaeota archaeon]|nr:hypothetical protein [Candidatus Woesearchaeota archaeon]